METKHGQLKHCVQIALRINFLFKVQPNVKSVLCVTDAPFAWNA